ncbi:MAG: SDR family NAD(P)-dependent oxidoreductase [Thermoguttaceae bacterium]
MRREIRGSRAIVTGASSGIGRALAIELARQGASQVATARRADRLTDLAREIVSAGGRVETVAGDIADPAVRARVIDAAKDALGGLDILVNNAGVGALGPFESADPQRLRRLMEVNFFALVEMTRLAVPLLKEGKRPMIVNVSSILGRRGVPHNTEYCASKFAVHGFSESLRAELARYPIDVLVVSPGTTRTEFFASVIDRTGEPNWPQHGSVSAEKVARAVTRAIRAGRHEIVPYGWGRVLLWLNRLAPRLVDRAMERYA